MVNTGLGQHSIVLKLRLAKRRAVASNDNKLGYKGKKQRIKLATRDGGRSLPNRTAHFFFYVVAFGLLSPVAVNEIESESLTLALTKSLQGRLVTKGVLARLCDELETRVDRLDVLLGLLDSRSHC